MYDVFLVVATDINFQFILYFNCFHAITAEVRCIQYRSTVFGINKGGLLAVRIKAVALLLVQVAWVCKSKYGCSVRLSWPKVNIIFWRADSVWTRKGNLRSPFGVHALWCEVVFGQYCTFMALKSFYCLYLHLYLNWKWIKTTRK